jgi:hypothetical protein
MGSQNKKIKKGLAYVALDDEEEEFLSALWKLVLTVSDDLDESWKSGRIVGVSPATLDLLRTRLEDDEKGDTVWNGLPRIVTLYRLARSAGHSLRIVLE